MDLPTAQSPATAHFPWRCSCFKLHSSTSFGFAIRPADGPDSAKARIETSHDLLPCSMHAANWAIPPQTHAPTVHDWLALKIGSPKLQRASEREGKGRRAHAFGGRTVYPLAQLNQGTGGLDRVVPSPDSRRQRDLTKRKREYRRKPCEIRSP
jgi:hypothetical protein